VQCGSLSGPGNCQSDQAGFTTCAGTTPSVVCTPNGAAPFTVVGCEQQFTQSLACAAGPCPVFGDSNPCTIDLCDAVNGATHHPAPAGEPCGDNKTCTAGGECLSTPGCKTLCTAVAAAGCVPGQSEADCEQSNLCQAGVPEECRGAVDALAACAGSAPVVTCDSQSLASISGCDRELLNEQACADFGPSTSACADVCSAVQGSGCASAFAAESACTDACGQAAQVPGCEASYQAFVECLANSPTIECSSSGSVSFLACTDAYAALHDCAQAGGSCVIPVDDDDP
jgi:hypothetical protein